MLCFTGAFECTTPARSAKVLLKRTFVFFLGPCNRTFVLFGYAAILFLSFFWVANTQLNHWTKMVATTQLIP